MSSSPRQTTGSHDSMCISQEFLPADLSRFCDCERVAAIRSDMMIMSTVSIIDEIEKQRHEWATVHDAAPPMSPEQWYTSGQVDACTTVLRALKSSVARARPK